MRIEKHIYSQPDCFKPCFNSREEDFFAEKENPQQIPNLLLRKIPLLETVLNLRNENLTARILNKTHFDFDLVQRSLDNVDNETVPEFKKYDKVVLKMEIAMNLTMRSLIVMSVFDDPDSCWLLLKDLQTDKYCEVESEKVLRKEMTENEREVEDQINIEKLREEIWIGTREILRKIVKDTTDDSDVSKVMNIDSFKVPYCV